MHEQAVKDKDLVWREDESGGGYRWWETYMVAWRCRVVDEGWPLRVSGSARCGSGAVFFLLRRGTW